MNVAGVIIGAVLLGGLVFIFGPLIADYLRERHGTLWIDWLAVGATAVGATCFMFGLGLSLRQTVAVWLGLVIAQLRFKRA